MDHVGIQYLDDTVEAQGGHTTQVLDEQRQLLGEVTFS